MALEGALLTMKIFFPFVAEHPSKVREDNVYEGSTAEPRLMNTPPPFFFASHEVKEVVEPELPTFRVPPFKEHPIAPPFCPEEHWEHEMFTIDADCRVEGLILKMEPSPCERMIEVNLVPPKLKVEPRVQPNRGQAWSVIEEN